MRDVIDLPSPENPARRSLLVAGAKDSETFFEPVKDLAASASVRARKEMMLKRQVKLAPIKFANS
jgi:hypothetical protein